MYSVEMVDMVDMARGQVGSQCYSHARIVYIVVKVQRILLVPSLFFHPSQTCHVQTQFFDHIVQILSEISMSKWNHRDDGKDSLCLDNNQRTGCFISAHDKRVI